MNSCVSCGEIIPEGRLVCPNCMAQAEEVGDIFSERLSIQSVVYPSLNSNPDGISADLFFKGCTLHCKGCHNLELQSFSAPNTSIHTVIKAINKNNVKILTLMGGEPLDVNILLLHELLKILKKTFPYLKISLYTGHELSEVSPVLFGYLDYIKTGRYDCTQLNPKGSFLASKNQHFYKIMRKGADRLVVREYAADGQYVDTDSVLYF